MPKAGGKWNTFLITAKGTNLIVEMNGKQTVNINDGSFPSGRSRFSSEIGTRAPRAAPSSGVRWRFGRCS